jgi:4-amino-4-deoxy-L-arabinose transferase-like glycosyltransferase
VTSASADRPDAALMPAAPGLRARWLFAALAVALAVRLATLGGYPLMDTSEARYGEIARVMRETGNWVTPQETPGTPFWAKPPLYAWLSAASTYVFGVDEFALRLPSMLCGLGVLVLCGVWTASLARRPSCNEPQLRAAFAPAASGDFGAEKREDRLRAGSATPLEHPPRPSQTSRLLDRPSPATLIPAFSREAAEGAVQLPSPASRERGRGRGLRERGGGEGADGAATAPLLACLILSTTVLFFIGYGAVMTDPALGLSTAWMLVAFQRAVIDGSSRVLWRYGFFVAAGLAMLAKGPVAFLYVAAPLAVWAFWRGRWQAIWRALPWVGGTALCAAVCLPWYIWAEARTPGFLNYFLVGEHLLRYLQPGWTGDRYGTAHREPFGTIWAYLAGALGLWSVLLLALVRPGRGWLARARAWFDDDGRLLALLAALVPLAVFTFAGNLIWTYALPVLTPLAALLGLELAQRSARPGPWRGAVTWVACASVALVCLGAIVWAPLRANGSSFAGPVAAWREQLRTRPGALLYWGRRTPASLRFYSRGAAEPAPDLDARLAGLQPGSRVYVAIAPEQWPALQQVVSAQPQSFELAVVGQVKHAVIVEIARRVSAL